LQPGGYMWERKRKRRKKEKEPKKIAAARFRDHGV
jgi:hypothetical protein